MRSQEGRQSRLGTAFHTKNTVICHILSKLCLNVTPILITRLTKLFCYSGISATVPAKQESNRRNCSWIITEQAGEGSDLKRVGAVGPPQEREGSSSRCPMEASTLTCSWVLECTAWQKGVFQLGLRSRTILLWLCMPLGWDKIKTVPSLLSLSVCQSHTK